MNIIALWNEDISLSWWKMLPIGLFFLIANFSIFFAMWYLRRAIVIELLYPKSSRRTIKKRLQKYSIWDNILLIKPSRDISHRNALIYINLICHFCNIAGLCLCIIGFIGCMFTLAQGWALTLLTVSELAIMMFTIMFEFIPHLLWLPSEKKRYGRK